MRNFKGSSLGTPLFEAPLPERRVNFHPKLRPLIIPSSRKKVGKVGKVPIFVAFLAGSELGQVGQVQPGRLVGCGQVFEVPPKPNRISGKTKAFEQKLTKETKGMRMKSAPRDSQTIPTSPNGTTFSSLRYLRYLLFNRLHFEIFLRLMAI